MQKSLWRNQKQSSVGKGFILNVAGPYSCPSTTYGSVSTTKHDSLRESKVGLEHYTVWPKKKGKRREEREREKMYS